MAEKKDKRIVVKLLMLLWYALTHPLVWIWRKLSGFFMHLNYRQIARKVVNAVGNFFHWLLFRVLIPKRYRNITKKQIYRIIFKADTPAGKRFDVWLLVLIGVNLVVIMLDSFEAVHSNLRWVLMGVEWLLTIIFTLEYYLRIYCLNKPWKYVFSFYGIIDFLSIFPAYLSLLIPATQTLTVLRVLRTLRIFRIFNMQRFLHESFHLLNAMRRSVTKILIFMLFVFIAAIILGSVIYMFEHGKNPAMSSIPTAIYWAVVTITTVGYGDITPVTPMGQFISTLVMLLGYSIIAVPTGIVLGETIAERKAENGERREENGERGPEGGEQRTEKGEWRAGSGLLDASLVPAEFNEYEDNSTGEAGPRFCTHCGHTEEDPDARFCRYCGTLLSKRQPSGWINDFFKS
ncbi:MAG: ion transporter [Bacteroidales bacterium]|nr:ion transporter [Bacteroidales bacterium]